MQPFKIVKSGAQEFIGKFLTHSELSEIPQCISNAYAAVDNVYKTTPALGMFMIGFDLRPHLLRVFVEHSLQKYSDNHDAFTHEVRPNTAKNCNHLRLYKDGLAITAHYMGAKCERPEARKALHKANLSERNGDLFAFENQETDTFKNIAYAQIMHGGVSKPNNILINIPSRDQLSIIGSMSLIIPAEIKVQVEQIIDETPFKLKETLEELQSGTS